MVLPSKRPWLAGGVQCVPTMGKTVLYLWLEQRPYRGAEDNRNNSLFIKHLLCARHSSQCSDE